jgi:hypothetical protein
MTIALSEVRDLDCVATLSPLTFDLGTSYVTGATAVLRRCLYAICTPRGALVWSEEAKGRGVNVFDLQNASLTTSGIAGWKRAIVRQLKAVDYVVDATAGLVLFENTWIVAATVLLEDGGTYPLEVNIADAAVAITSLGAT